MTGGGTGGHVYPALSVAEALRTSVPGGRAEIVFAGTRRGDVERLATEAGLPFVPIDASALRGRSPLAMLGGAAHLWRGTTQAIRVVRRFRPDVTFATGGYAGVPVALAARLQRVPLVVYLPDVYPGWAVRMLARIAARVAVSSEASARHLPAGKTVATGYPVRERFWSTCRQEARRLLGLPEAEPVLLVTGASQGARALNEAVFDALETLTAQCSVVHQTGVAGIDEAHGRAAGLEGAARVRYRPYAYLDAKPSAMAAADLAVMRAGASSLAEPPAAGLPTILVPGTFAGGHQRHNAEFMAERGAALLLDQQHLDRLAPTVVELLHDRERLRAMAGAARELARPRAAEAIARVLVEVAA